MKKNVFMAGISMICCAIWMLGGCTNDPSGGDRDSALLLGLNNTMTEEQAAFSIVTALPGVQDMSQTSGGSSSVASTKEMITEMNKSASYAFLKSELGVQGPRESVSFVTDDTCESGTCYTLSGTGTCANGGSVTFNDMNMTLTVEPEGNGGTFAGSTDGSATYAQCGGNAHNWLTYPEYVYAVIDGTVTQNDQFNDVFVLLGGDVLSGAYTMSSTETGTRTVTSAMVSVNGMVFSQVELNCTTDLMRTSQISNQTQITEGNIMRMSGDRVETITGHVTITGTLGPDNDINAERIFNTETFRYHSDCIMDSENFGVSCSVRAL